MLKEVIDKNASRLSLCQFWNVLKLLATPSTTPALFGGGLLGYVMYDVTHYYLHHGQPSREVPRNLKVKTTLSYFILKELADMRGNRVEIEVHVYLLLFLVLQKYHLNHHFRIQNKGFGITSSMWDRVFGTLPQSKSAVKSR